VTEHLRTSGGFASLARRPAADLRAELLAIRGVGPETADSILLYAHGQRVFVVDAYTRRIFERLGLIDGGESYETIRSFVEGALPGGAPVLNEMHALLVEHAKRHCRKTPLCHACPLRRACRHARAALRSPAPAAIVR